MKKRILVVSLILLVLTALGSGTLAYFSTKDTAHNVITSGNIDIEIIEKTRGDDNVLVDFPEGGISGVMPGADVSKIVSVKNTGSASAWIRVQVEQSITASGNPLPEALKDGTPVITFTVDPAKWLEEDGWYYYKQEVAAGAVTDVLFEEVCFAPQMNNDYQGCTAHIGILAEAVQSDNNAIPGNGTVADVKGW